MEGTLISTKNKRIDIPNIALNKYNDEFSISDILATSDSDIIDQLMKTMVEQNKENIDMLFTHIFYKVQKYFHLSDRFNKELIIYISDRDPLKNDINIGELFRDNFMKRLAKFQALMKINHIESMVVFNSGGGLTEEVYYELENKLRFKDSVHITNVYKRLYIELLSYLIKYKLKNNIDYPIGKYGVLIIDEEHKILLNIR